MKDYYKILQVAPDASTEVIQMAYKALAKKYHPDLNPGQEEAAQEKMKDVNEAYEILSDKDKRWQYDQIYYRQEKTAQKTSYSAPEPPKRAQTHSAQSKGEQTSAAPVDPTPEDKEKTSSGKGCAKTGCGCLVVFVVLFILIGLFGGSSSDSDSDKKPSSSDAASVTATSEMSVAASEAEEVKPKEELVYTLENLEKASSTYNKSENPYYKDSVAQYAEAINIIYGENTSQTVTEMTLEQALKDSDVSRLFVEKLLKLQGEDVMSDSDFYRMDVKTDSGIVKTLLTMESERQYMEVSSLPKDRIGDYEEILFYYGGMKENKPNGNGALFAYSTRNGLSLQYVGKFKDGKIEGKGISFTYDGLVHYLAHAGNYEKNMATGKMTTYYDNDCQAIGNFFLYKFGDYIDEMSEKWSEDELVRQIDLLLPQKRVLKLIVTVNLYESPSTTVDFNQRVLIPHIKYEGKMKKGSIEGKGKLYASDGWLAYDGEWKKDKYNGKGILYNQDFVLDTAPGFPTGFDVHLIVVAAEVDGVFVFFLEILLEVQRVVGLAGKSHPALPCKRSRRGFHRVGAQRIEQHFGIQRAVKAVRKHDRLFIFIGHVISRAVFRCAGSLKEAVIAEECTVTGPVVVRPEKHIPPAFCGFTHRFAKVNQAVFENPACLFKGLVLIEPHRIIRQSLLIDIRGSRHEHRLELCTVCLASLLQLLRPCEVLGIPRLVKIRLGHALYHPAAGA